MTARAIALYLRVSSRTQDARSQRPDLERWVQAFAGDRPARWYQDTATGTTMDRPGWKSLESAITGGEIETLVVWRLDRLGRTAAGLTALFDELRRRRVNLVSIRDGLDLSTPAGAMLANILASVAQYETEVRRERQLAGQAAARAAGKTWGGSKPGVRKQVKPEQEELVRRLKDEGAAIAAIARATGLSRPTVYDVLRVAAP
jgi:DNA invertase Pin-like site-specific DNA recombinase